MFNFFVSLYHFLWALFSALFFGFPSKKIKVIGVTGTSGKSTVVDLATDILEKKGFKVAVLSSIKIKIANKEEENLFKMTMPGRGYLQKFLKKANDKGCQYAIIEVTSEGILQHRHKFINFNTAVFTNLYPEHIERHGSFENYRAAKVRLFQSAKEIHILNLDDKNVEYFLRSPAKKKIGFTVGALQPVDRNKEKIELIKAENCQEDEEGASFKVNNVEFHLNLLGKFNIQNALAAICIGISQDVPLETCKRALEKISGIPGRMEIVAKKPFKVIVDYAHTPDALQKVYSTLSEKSKIQKNPPESRFGRQAKSKMICVLGSCGGGRDKWKRPKLGKIASRFCDEIIITNEDPYDEDPCQILSMIKSGITKSQFPISNFYEILDRREAIRKSLQLAKEGDIVVITGKGCEPWMCIERGKKISWDDRQVVKEEFQKLKDK